MATISENIQRINKAKTDIKNAIIAKGGSVADNDKIDTYATAIEALPSGGGTELPQNLSRLVTDDWGRPKKITIKGSVTTIPNDAYENVPLEDVIISDGVTIIGDSAFSYCSALTGITIPDSVTYISAKAFERCSALSGITIPESVTTIGDNAFSVCSGLTSITIPNGVTSIKSFTFFYCSALSDITIGNGITSIESTAFYQCTGLATITIKATTPPTLGSSAIPNNVTAIYVPSDSVDAYKSASGWSNYADKIQPIQE